MTRPATLPGRHGGTGRLLDSGSRLVAGASVLIGILVIVTAIRAVNDGGGSSAGIAGTSAGPTASAGGTAASGPAGSGGPVDVGRYLVTPPIPAPALALTDQDDQPFDLASLRGSPVFVFFGYTHCPDVCPATVGRVGQTMEAFGGPVRAVFVSVDPERDTPAWLREYVRYLASGFVGVTGSADRIAAVAAAWGVRYAKVETGTPGEYSMSHTADVALVDAGGTIRARFPFGTEADAMTATLRAVAAATPPPTPSTAPPSSAPASLTPSASSTTAPIAGLDVTVGSSSVWAGPAGPVILDLSAGGVRIDDPDLVASVQLATIDGTPVGAAVPTIAMRPPGETRVVYVASPSIPAPGWWRLTVTVVRGGFTLLGSTDLAALDPGASAAIGGPAPTVRTPTLDDVGGLAKAVTTDPAPDLRLSRTSTVDALAAHQPFVLVVDSWRFKVTSACGRALVMARYLADRWGGIAFIHLEPLRYDVITDTPVLQGSLADPTLTDAAAAWGLAGAPWGATSMPWVFVVDANGIVR
ncbi:MAG TPA: SCO family protein, partial [Candidatus Deferrimicrobium sp.]|nr:SCO family protein [Candidatus Deferrimicrobium sp.]